VVSDDYEMIQAVVLAKNSAADPTRERTIGKSPTYSGFVVSEVIVRLSGVLTKPDTLAIGATGGRKRWMDILEGREHATKHGYYSVRLPDDEQRARGLSRAEAHSIADDFFNSTPPWDRLIDRSRLGIPNFVANISALLVQLIEKK